MVPGFVGYFSAFSDLLQALTVCISTFLAPVSVFQNRTLKVKIIEEINMG